MSYGVVQVIIDESSPRTINGIYEWERDNGGVLIAPAGSAFPTSGIQPGEIFWRTDESILYRRNDANTTWEATNGTVAAHADTHEDGGADEIDVTGLSGVLADPQTPASHSHTESDITDLDHYTTADFTTDHAALTGTCPQAPQSHTHTESDITDLDHDAVSLQGYDISTAMPTSGEFRMYEGSSGEWEPTAFPDSEIFSTNESSRWFHLWR